MTGLSIIYLVTFLVVSKSVTKVSKYQANYEFPVLHQAANVCETGHNDDADDYCVENNSLNVTKLISCVGMEKLDWKNDGLECVKDAGKRKKMFPSYPYDVLKTLGKQRPHKTSQITLYSQLFESAELNCAEKV